MKVLVIGSGGREHAIAWHARKDPRVTGLFIAPGNAGTAQLGTNLPIAANDLPGLLAWAEKERPDWTIVGPEEPLCLGVVDRFAEKGLAAFGPNQSAARLEGSKAFAKRLFLKHRLPTAAGAIFSDPLEAYAHSQKAPYPQVIKADGLAAGKGVVIAKNPDEAAKAIYRIMERRAFGDAGREVVIEECLTGPEISVLAVTDGKTYQLLPLAQDHKRVGDGDTGPNTGGMGAYAPARFLDEATRRRIEEEVLAPLLAALPKEGIDYKGILYAGLMLTPTGPQLLEINCRLGDPETQVILPLLETPLVDIAAAVARGELGSLELRFNDLSALGVVAAAPGYPEAPRLDGPIEGIDLPATGNRYVFHAGTGTKGGRTVTRGGRVATAVAWDRDLETARRHAYELVEGIGFAGKVFRRDIGARAQQKT
ncbi:MAG: phosphoribosylamine--glycine ligase [Verrucomicrobium sp.]|nr:phosphoribosylamine--glycine ligase [Verrucomicrobium sp.]